MITYCAAHTGRCEFFFQGVPWQFSKEKGEDVWRCVRAHRGRPDLVWCLLIARLLCCTSHFPFDPTFAHDLMWNSLFISILNFLGGEKVLKKAKLPSHYHYGLVHMVSCMV